MCRKGGAPAGSRPGRASPALCMKHIRTQFYSHRRLLRSVPVPCETGGKRHETQKRGNPSPVILSRCRSYAAKDLAGGGGSTAQFLTAKDGARRARANGSIGDSVQYTEKRFLAEIAGNMETGFGSHVVVTVQVRTATIPWGGAAARNSTPSLSREDPSGEVNRGERRERRENEAAFDLVSR